MHNWVILGAGLSLGIILGSTLAVQVGRLGIEWNALAAIATVVATIIALFVPSVLLYIQRKHQIEDKDDADFERAMDSHLKNWLLANYIYGALLEFRYQIKRTAKKLREACDVTDIDATTKFVALLADPSLVVPIPPHIDRVLDQLHDLGTLGVAIVQAVGATEMSNIEMKKLIGTTRISDAERFRAGLLTLAAPLERGALALDGSWSTLEKVFEGEPIKKAQALRLERLAVRGK